MIKCYLVELKQNLAHRNETFAKLLINKGWNVMITSEGVVVEFDTKESIKNVYTEKGYFMDYFGKYVIALHKL